MSLDEILQFGVLEILLYHLQSNLQTPPTYPVSSWGIPPGLPFVPLASLSPVEFQLSIEVIPLLNGTWR
jgi:hypothetical protein